MLFTSSAQPLESISVLPVTNAPVMTMVKPVLSVTNAPVMTMVNVAYLVSSVQVMVLAAALRQ